MRIWDFYVEIEVRVQVILDMRIDISLGLLVHGQRLEKRPTRSLFDVNPCPRLVKFSGERQNAGVACRHLPNTGLLVFPKSMLPINISMW